MRNLVSKKWDLLFFVLLVGVALLYSYYNVMFMRPWSVHQWRQCDCLSIALNYYKEGMHFFTPAIHSSGITGDGKTCTSECPIIYYTAAILWQIFGYHEFIYRLLIVSIGFTGLYFLFRLAKELLEDGLWALLVSLFLFSSPIFAYYSSSFLSDLPALCFAIMAWYFFFRFYKEGKNKYYNISILLFLLAGLTKVTALLSFVPFVFVFLLEVVGKKKFRNGEKLFNKPLKQSIPIVFLILVILLWNEYVFHYNQKHFGGVFSTGIMPIWEMSQDEIWNALLEFYNKVLPQFLNISGLIGVLLLFIGIVLLNKRINKLLLILCVSVFAGSILYIILWFRVFAVLHDYYLMNLLIFVPLVLITFLCFLKKENSTLFKSWKIKIIATVIVVFSLYSCAVQTQIKYSTSYSLAKYSYLLTKEDIQLMNWWVCDYSFHIGGEETITPYLRSLGINRTDKVVSMPDQSFNISLYLMDQKGYTDFDCNNAKAKTGLLKGSIYMGAKYFIINDTAILRQDWIKPFTTNKIGKYKNIMIYRLDPSMSDVGARMEKAKNNIRSNPEWMSRITKGAKEQDISLDSAITLNAIWVLRTEQ